LEIPVELQAVEGDGDEKGLYLSALCGKKDDFDFGCRDKKRR
jgi:hypothetical protein